MLAGLSLRRGVEEVDRENLEDESSAREIFDDRLCIFDVGKGHGGAVRPHKSDVGFAPTLTP